jgi:hypothetical protein
MRVDSRSAPSLEQAVEIAQGILPREFTETDDLPASWALLPSPRTSDTNGPGHHGDGGPDLRTVVDLLPTPAVNDMGEGKTFEWWDEWAPRQKAADGTPAPHGKSLAIEAQRMAADGAPTPPPSTDGNPSWDEPPLFPPTTEDD